MEERESVGWEAHRAGEGVPAFHLISTPRPPPSSHPIFMEPQETEARRPVVLSLLSEDSLALSWFLGPGLGQGQGLSRIFKVRLSVHPGKWKWLVPAEERPLSG